MSRLDSLILNLELVYKEKREGKNETLGRCNTRVMIVFEGDGRILPKIPLGVEIDEEGRIGKISKEAFHALQAVHRDPVFVEWALHAFSKRFFPDSPTELGLEATERLCKIYPVRPS